MVSFSDWSVLLFSIFENLFYSKEKNCGEEVEQCDGFEKYLCLNAAKMTESILSGNLSSFIDDQYWNRYEYAPDAHFYHQMDISTQSPLSGGNVNEELGAVSNITTKELAKYRLPLWGICTLIVGYTFVFFFGLIGNCSVLIVVARLHRMKTVTNYFICNLAFADLLVLLFCLLPNLISSIFIRKFFLKCDLIYLI